MRTIKVYPQAEWRKVTGGQPIEITPEEAATLGVRQGQFVGKAFVQRLHAHRLNMGSIVADKILNRAATPKPRTDKRSDPRMRRNFTVIQ